MSGIPVHGLQRKREQTCRGAGQIRGSPCHLGRHAHFELQPLLRPFHPPFTYSFFTAGIASIVPSGLLEHNSKFLASACVSGERNMSGIHPTKAEVEDHLTKIQGDLVHTISLITSVSFLLDEILISSKENISRLINQRSKATSPSNKALEILNQLFDLSSNVLKYFKAGGSGEDPTFDFWDNCGFACRSLKGRFDRFLEREVHNILSIPVSHSCIMLKPDLRFIRISKV
jgi:hypothetical protein